VPESAWQLAAALRAGPSNGRPASVAAFGLTLVCNGESRTLRAPPDGVAIDSWADGIVQYTQDGVRRRAVCVDDGAVLYLALDAAVCTFTEPSPYPTRDSSADASRARAPVAGVVAQVLVSAGDRVAAGQPMVCVEAMKMEMWLNAGAAGTVRAVHAKAKEPVAAGALLVELDIET
jgi:geranyl-CoA carboxylase alpha subunit